MQKIFETIESSIHAAIVLLEAVHLGETNQAQVLQTAKQLIKCQRVLNGLVHLYPQNTLLQKEINRFLGSETINENMGMLLQNFKAQLN